MKKSSKLKDWIEGVIKDFIVNSSENTLQNSAHEKAFDEPLVGFSSGDDSIYESYKAYCLFFSKGICGKCIPRCPVGALNEDGHDKLKCYNHLKPVTADYVKSHYGFDGYGCGLCQTKVPCESKIPTKQDVE